MKYILQVLLGSILLIFSSCSSPLDKPFKKDSLEEDIILIKKTISESDLELLTGYISLKSLGDSQMLGLTYSDLLKEAKELKSEIEKSDLGSQTNKPETTKEIISEKPKTELKENGHFIFDYNYNIALKRKDITPHNILLSKDEKSINISGKKDTWRYDILEVLNSTVDEYKVRIHGGNTAFDDNQDYELTINEGMAKMVRLSNNAKWWYINESARRPFEKELEKAGLAFHK